MEAIDLKDTQYSWLGSIPEEWKKVSLKYLFYIQKGRKPSIEYEEYQDGLLPYLSMDVLRGKNDFPVYTSPLEDKTLVLASEEDILILWDGSKAGEFVPGTKGALSSTMARMSLINQAVDQTFLMYYLKNSESYIQNNTIGMGIPHVDGDVLRNLPIFLPSLPEQKQIARFIDHQTGLIDAVIAKKETLIKKLKEQRQATINEAVTKGLNPNTPLKDSGIPWLGEIPEHWEVVKLKYLIKSVETGKTPSTAVDAFFEGGTINWFSPGDFKSLILSDSNKKITEYAVEKNKLNLYPKDSILLIGIGATLGKVAIATVECFSNQQINAIITNKKLLPYFGLYYLNAIKDVIRNESNASTMAILNQSKTKDLTITLPPIEEQQVIIDSINDKEAKFDEGIKTIEAQIDKLREYRKSIISEVVTGKIDVREWKPKNN